MRESVALGCICVRSSMESIRRVCRKNGSAHVIPVLAVGVVRREREGGETNFR
jgi:hypothetical protein